MRSLLQEHDAGQSIADGANGFDQLLVRMLTCLDGKVAAILVAAILVGNIQRQFALVVGETLSPIRQRVSSSNPNLGGFSADFWILIGAKHESENVGSAMDDKPGSVIVAAKFQADIVKCWHDRTL